MANEIVTASDICPGCGRTECAPDCRWVPPNIAPPGEPVRHEYIGKLGPNWYCRGWSGKRQKYCKARAGAKTAHPREGRCNKHGGNRAITHGQRVGDPTSVAVKRYANIQHERLRDKLAKFEADPAPLHIVAELNLARALLEDFIERHEEFSNALLAWFESFKASGRQLPANHIEALRWVCDEFEVIALEQYENGNGETAKDKLQLARQTIDRLGAPIQEGRPRKMVDIIEARSMIETIRGLVESMQKHDEATHISRPHFFRFNAELGRVVNVVLEKHLAPDVAALIGREIGEKWLNVRLPA